MPAIGYVRRTGKGFEGNLNTPSVKSKVAIVANIGKTNEGQPDDLVLVDGAEVGGAWIRGRAGPPGATTSRSPSPHQSSGRGG